MIRGYISASILAMSLVAACTADGQGPSPTDPVSTPTTTSRPPPSTTTTVTPPQAVESYHRCLATNGIDIEPIPLDAQGRPRLDLVMREVDFSDPDTVTTLSLCSEHLTTGALDLTGSPLIHEGVVTLLTEFSVCVRSQGVPGFPDPIPGFIGIGSPYPPAEIPYSDPDLSEAIAECRTRLAGS